MNRRAFIAALAAPFVARHADLPAYYGQMRIFTQEEYDVTALALIKDNFYATSPLLATLRSSASVEFSGGQTVSRLIPL